MKEFSVFRYLKQFSLLIFLLAVVGSLAVFFYGQSQQRYIASTVIQYTNDGAKDGYTPDGSPLNVEEIYCPTVIDAALTDLGYPTNIDAIRSSCYVEEEISEKQRKLNEALLEKGQEPDYSTDTYRVYYIGDNDSGEEFAWDMLDAIINNYYEFYAGKYVEEQLQNNGVSVLAEGNYDYLESAQVLEDSVWEMLNYLQDKRESHPYFRSVETGYTYSDLYRIYSFLYNYEIPGLYASILTDAETGDIELLKSRLTQDCEDLQLYIENRQARADSLRTLIDNYSNRNKEMMDYHYHSSATQGIGTEYILKDVEYSKENGNKETTYDGLIQEYVDLNISIRQKELEKEHKEYLLSVFDTDVRSEDRKTPDPEEIRGKIAHCANLATKYYHYVEETGHELNRYLSANYLKMVSSINVQPAVNIKLYLAIAIVLFVLVGGVVAVLLGRALDFIDYFRYIDKAVQLPNRAKCDVYINEHSEKLLASDFSCLVLRMDSLGSLSSAYGREVGDGVLKDFAMILKSFGDSYGFVGYNGSGVFLAFFPDCSSQKTDVILEAVRRQVLKYNSANPEQKICYTYGKAVSSADNAFEIRQLLRLAMQRMASGQCSPVLNDTSVETGETDQQNHAETGKAEAKKPETETTEAEKPAAVNPGTEKTEDEKPDAEKPVTENADVEKPDAEKSVVENADTGNADAEKPVAENADAEKPDAEKTVTENADAEKPNAEKSVAENTDTGNADAEKTVTENADAENADAEKPDDEKSETENPETKKSETGEPEIRKPEAVNQEAENPEAEKSEVAKPEAEKSEPEKPEIEKSEPEKTGAGNPVTEVSEEEKSETVITETDRDK